MSDTGFKTSDNTDLVKLYKAIGSTTATSNTGFISNNTDLANIFAPYVAGTKAITTGYKISDGKYLSDIFQNTNSNLTWTEREREYNRNWYSVASSSDGSKLVACVYGGKIYTGAYS